MSIMYARNATQSTSSSTRTQQVCNSKKNQAACPSTMSDISKFCPKIKAFIG